MSLHDYVIDNQIGINFRVDLNLVLAAIVSLNSNATEPTTMFAYMFWADTTDNILKQRNSSNTAWVNILDLSTGASVATAINDLTNGTTEGTFNTGLGDVALSSNTTGVNNTALGAGALNLNIIGDNNTALGNKALLENTTSDNTAIGARALKNNTTGDLNTAMGSSALDTNTIGVQNTAIGFNALMNNTTGDENVALGLQALFNNTSALRNIAIGNNAGNNITTEEYTITTGYNLQSLGSNYFTFGKNAGSDRVYNQFTANATWTRASDERIKKDIQTNNDCGLGFINALRTVTYKFKAPNELDPSLSEYDKDNDKPSHDKKMYGFIAQEVKEVLEKHNIKDFAGWHIDENGKDKMQGISYEMFVMPLVKAVQELVIKNQGLSDRIDEQNAAIDDLILRVEALENLTR
jgi:hypothetical protein